MIDWKCVDTIVRAVKMISKVQGHNVHLTLVGDNVLEVNETPMRIRDIIVTGKQVRALKPAQAKPTKKDKNKEDSK
jgi:predicted SpoU family rRNA methylase